MRRLKPEEVQRQLEKALKAKDRHKIANQFIDYLLSYLIKPENLEAAVKNNVELTTVLFNHCHLSNPLIFPLFKLAVKLYWNEIEEYLTNVPKIYSLLAQNPSNTPILEKPETKKYLNTQITKLYQTLYMLAWWT